MWFPSRTVFIFLLLGCTSFGFSQENDWSPVLKGKIEKAIASIYQSDNLEFQAVEIDESAKEPRPSLLKGNLFKVAADGEFNGYAYVAQAPSMKNVFDYLIVLDKAFSIEKAKVLIYREQHGRQIGTARWLSQFKGMGIDDRPELGNGVDGISGATISARSMTVAINDLLTTLSMVKEKGVL